MGSIGVILIIIHEPGYVRVAQDRQAKKGPGRNSHHRSTASQASMQVSTSDVVVDDTELVHQSARRSARQALRRESKLGTSVSLIKG